MKEQALLMKALLLAFAATALIAGCSSTPDTTQVSERVDCRNVEPPTGSNHIRRRNCYPATPGTEDQARQSARDLQDLQQQITPGVIR
jgi:uncharacterized protein YceK